MSLGGARPPGLLVGSAHLEKSELLPMCRRFQDWMLVTWIKTRHQPQLCMTAVMTEPLLRALHLGADLFRLRHCPHHWCDAA
jgi:hypothetical protein